jgi:hypothetical protein
MLLIINFTESIHSKSTFLVVEPNIHKQTNAINGSRLFIIIATKLETGISPRVRPVAQVFRIESVHKRLRSHHYE